MMISIFLIAFFLMSMFMQCNGYQLTYSQKLHLRNNENLKETTRKNVPSAPFNQFTIPRIFRIYSATKPTHTKTEEVEEEIELLTGEEDLNEALYEEEIRKIMKEFQQQANASLYLPNITTSSSSKLYGQPSPSQSISSTQQPERRLIDINQAFYEVITDQIAKGNQNISTEIIIEQILAQQNENGTIPYPLTIPVEENNPNDLKNDPEYGPLFQEIVTNLQKPITAIKEFFQMNDKLLSSSLQQWREYAVNGIEYFKQNELLKAKESFHQAAALQVNQTLQQRGMLLYCLGEYQSALEQFLLDIKHLEKPKLYKACDLRLWASACYNRLEQYDQAIAILDIENTQGYESIEDTPLMNMTMKLFAKRIHVDEMIEFLSDTISTTNNDDDDDEEEENNEEEKERRRREGWDDESDAEEDALLNDAIDDEFMSQIEEKYKDIEGNYFYGNFYVALYYDSMKEEELMKAFIEYPRNSNRYPPTDMWYHLPRVLYQQRFGNEDDDGLELEDNNETD